MVEYEKSSFKKRVLFVVCLFCLCFHHSFLQKILGIHYFFLCYLLVLLLVIILCLSIKDGGMKVCLFLL